MDLDKLRVFHAVAEAGSLTYAGKLLNISQSAVSRQISAFEESIEVILFRRHARGLVLTEQGEILFNETKDVFEKLAKIKGQLQDSRKLDEGPLTITVSEFIGSTWLSPKLAKLREEAPGIQMTVLFDERLLNLNIREADAAIRLIKSTEPDLIQRHLTKIHFHLCGSRAYFAKHGEPKSTNDLKDHCLIGFPKHIAIPFRRTNKIFDIAGINIKENHNILMMNSMYAIQKAVVTGAGIALLPDYLIAENDEFKVILPKTENHTVDMYLVYAKERKDSQRIVTFRDFLLRSIKNTTFSINYT